MPYSCPQLHPRTNKERTKLEVGSREVAFGRFQSREELTSQSCLARSLKPMGRAHVGLDTSGMSSAVPCPQHKVWSRDVGIQSLEL